MKKSRLLVLTILTVFVFSVGNVKASDAYYVNDNGISFTKEEYDFFTKMYYDGYQKTMTQENLDQFAYSDMNIDNIEVKEYEEIQKEQFNAGNMYFVNSTIHETQAKLLRISKTAGTYPTIVISLSWKGSPTVRSYDLIGAYIAGPSVLGGYTTVLNYSDGSISPSARKTTSNGHGAVVKLPNSGSNIVASQTVTVTGSGRVYASYQHAKSSITLNSAQSFDIQSYGLGSVFYFDSLNIRNKYDAMGGVYIDV